MGRKVDNDGNVPLAFSYEGFNASTTTRRRGFASEGDGNG